MTTTCCDRASVAPADSEHSSPQAESIMTASTTITWRDVLGGWRVRWGIGRMHYLVSPGLYRIGKPNKQSPVLVTANYKLTFDAVRRELVDMDAWLLVLDTKGVNVWCAAGKGTFGTTELVKRVDAVGLASVVEHRDLVVPQLGAVGVAAHKVKCATGFTVHYGPVHARDIKSYLASHMRATLPMRRVTFDWKERLVLAPMELAGVLKFAIYVLSALTVLHVLQHRGLSWHVIVDFMPFLAAILAGGVVVPLLLPWLPTRVFAVKGAVAGGLCVAGTLLMFPGGPIEVAGAALLGTALATYMGMVFTGATTFTNLPGARLEVRWALPVVIGAAALGAILRVAAAFV